MFGKQAAEPNPLNPDAQPAESAQAKPAGGKKDGVKISDLEAKVEGFIAADNFKQAQGAADELIARDPGNYEHYLLRARIYSALREYPKSVEDNENALQIFHDKVDKYKAEEQNVRLAKIYENLAFTYLAAELNTKDEAKKKEFDGKFYEFLKKVKDHDQATFEHAVGILKELKK